MKLVSALKEGATFSSLATLVVKMKQTEGVFVVNIEGTFPSNPNKNVHTSTSTSMSSPIFSLFRYTQATHAALVFLGVARDFNPLQEFQFYFEEEYGGFR